MGKQSQNVILPPLQGINTAEDKNIEVIQKRLPRSMQIKDQYSAPTYSKPVKLKTNDSGSGRSTKHSSADKINVNNSSDSNEYGLGNKHSQFKRISGQQLDNLTDESEDNIRMDLKRMHQEKPLSYGDYRKALAKKKKLEKQATKNRMREMVERKNSSNGSIDPGNSSASEINMSIRRESTNKLINKINAINSKNEVKEESKRKTTPKTEKRYELVK